jgi:hypothetical protein
MAPFIGDDLCVVDGDRVFTCRVVAYVGRRRMVVDGVLPRGPIRVQVHSMTLHTTLLTFAHKLPDFVSSLVAPIVACGLVVSLSAIVDSDVRRLLASYDYYVSDIVARLDDRLKRRVRSIFLSDNDDYVAALREYFLLILLQRRTIPFTQIERCSDGVVAPYKLTSGLPDVDVSKRSRV